MPNVETKYFGTMPFDEESSFEFPWGLPAFEEERRFLPLQMPGYKPLVFLQSTANSGLCFVAIPVLVAEPEYELAVSPEDLRALGLDPGRQPRIGSEVLVLALLSMREEAPTTANLLAPVIVNLATRQALQAIRHDAVYSHAQPLAAQECAC